MGTYFVNRGEKGLALRLPEENTHMKPVATTRNAQRNATEIRQYRKVFRSQKRARQSFVLEHTTAVRASAIRTDSLTQCATTTKEANRGLEHTTAAPADT